MAILTTIFNQYCFESPLKKMPDSLSFHVKVCGVSSVYVLHDLRQITLRSFQEQVKMITHQAVNMDLRAVPNGCRFQVRQKLLSISSTLENISALITTCGHMIERSRVCYAQRSCH